MQLNVSFFYSYLKLLAIEYDKFLKLSNKS